MILRTVQQKRTELLVGYYITITILIALLILIEKTFNIPTASVSLFISKAKLALIVIEIVSIFVNITVFLLIHGFFVGGFRYALLHRRMLVSVRKELVNSGIFTCRYYGNEKVAVTPKIMLEFKKDMQTGFLKIRTSLNDNSKIESDKISCALGCYIVERQYLSEDYNWNIYELFDSTFDRQYKFENVSEFIAASKSKLFGNYEFMIDKVTTSVKLSHCLITGVTGGGKSVLLYEFILQMLAKPIEYKIYFCDPKQSGLGVLGRYIAPERTAVTVDEIISLLKDFNQEMNQRKQDMEQSLCEARDIDVDYKTFGYPPVVLVIDEYLSFNEALSTYPKAVRDEVQAILSAVVLQGRQIGCFVWIAQQSSPANQLPSFIRDNLICKICMGNADQGTIVTTFGVSADVPNINYPIGYGCYTYSGKVNTPKLLAVPTIEHFNVVEALDELKKE